MDEVGNKIETVSFGSTVHAVDLHLFHKGQPFWARLSEQSLRRGKETREQTHPRSRYGLGVNLDVALAEDGKNTDDVKSPGIA